MMNLSRRKNLVLLAEHFLGRLWQAEPRFLRGDPM
jgi:hypothetical protein